MLQLYQKDKVPEGVTVKVKEVKAGTTPTTAEVTETGKPKPATVVIEYTDDKGNVIGTKEVEVPVTVVGSIQNQLWYSKVINQLKLKMP